MVNPGAAALEWSVQTLTLTLTLTLALTLTLTLTLTPTLILTIRGCTRQHGRPGGSGAGVERADRQVRGHGCHNDHVDRGHVYRYRVES